MPHPMRIAIVSETYPPEVNGVALTVQSLALGLRARGHAVELIRPRLAGEAAPATAEQLLLPSLPLPRYPGLRLGLPAGRSLRSRWQRQQPDAIYIATEGPLGASSLREARRLGIPVCTGFHTRFDEYATRYGVGFLRGVVFAWLRRFHNRADATLVPTRELMQFLAAQDFAHVTLLRRAVDTVQFNPGWRSPELRARWGADAETPALIHVGRIAPEKNLTLAVRAFRRVQQVQPRARMIWVGDGPDRAALADAHPDFVFCGVQRGEALTRHFASADLFVFPSLSETFGNVTLEAMASGLATIAFDTGAAREHLRHGAHGAAIPVTDDEAFIAATAALAGDLALSRRMGAAAREAIAHLAPHNVSLRFEQVLRELIERRATAVLSSPATNAGRRP